MGAAAGAVSGFREVGGVVGLVAVLPAERQMGKEEAHLAALMAERIARPNLFDWDSSALLVSLDSEEERWQSWACSPQCQQGIQKLYKVTINTTICPD